MSYWPPHLSFEKSDNKSVYLVFWLAGHFEVAIGRILLRRTTEGPEGTVGQEVFFEEAGAATPRHRLSRRDWYPSERVFASREGAEAEANYLERTSLGRSGGAGGNVAVAIPSRTSTKEP